MKTAVVTGASRGIGAAISAMLLKNGWKVIGIARDFSETGISDANFVPVACDLRKSHEFENLLRQIEKDEQPEILVNNAGVAYFSLHEEMNRSKIEETVAVNLVAPMTATQIFLRGLKKRKGHIINISSVTARKSSPFAAVYAASKAALTSFSESIFDEGRKSGLRVTVIHPDMTKTEFYRNAFFRESDEAEGYILAECVASAVETVLKTRSFTVITEITVKPLHHQIGRKKNNGEENDFRGNLKID